MSIGVAILGGGIFAREEHLPAIRAAKDLCLKAVYSRSLQSARSLTVSGEAAFDCYSDDSGPGQSLDDLLARTDIQAVTIALPITKQAGYIRKALQAGKHVLSEKPIAETVEQAIELIRWYKSEVDTTKVFWSVAENFRFLRTFEIASQERMSQGKPLTFRLQMQSLVSGGKYFETEWRKTPSYQGGFLLDGGVHFIAGIRMLLGQDDYIVSVSANTAQLQPHLPPVDTIEATARTKSGAVGSISISFGTTFKGREYSVATEKGTVTVGFDEIIVDGQKQEVKNERSGVPPEVRAWAEAIVTKVPNPLQSPEEALADLSILEALLRSGEKGGIPVTPAHSSISASDV